MGEADYHHEVAFQVVPDEHVAEQAGVFPHVIEGQAVGYGEILDEEPDLV